MKKNTKALLSTFRKQTFALSRTFTTSRIFTAGRIFISGTALLFFTLWPAAAAEITVPKLEMASRGRMVENEFVVSSVISADMTLSGGYKYTFSLGFSIDAADISRSFAYRNFGDFYVPPGGSSGTGVSEDDINALADRVNNQAVLGFRTAKATARDLFNLPLELTYFMGTGDDFCTGDEFSTRYGLAPFGTDFRGFFYFPDGIGGNPTRRYNGIHGARGTGFSVGLTQWDKFTPIVYLYQDYIYSGTVFGANVKNLYSGDLRFLIYYDWLRLEAFSGISWNSDIDRFLRGGFMINFDMGNGAEIFVQAGITSWDWDESLNVDNLFFLVEPRLRFKYFGVFVTFFYHPVEYLHIYTEDERGRADLNIKFLFGNEESGFTGGLETGGDLKIDKETDFKMQIAPFCSFITSGLRWDTKLRIRPFGNDTPSEMYELFIGVRTSF